MGAGVAGMSESPTGMVDSLKRACLGILVAAIAINLAVGVVQSVWPALLLIAGIAGIIWLSVVVYKAWRERW